MRDIDLLVIGEVNADLILSGTDPIPEFGQVEKVVETGVLTMGSSSVITACGAARLGLRTAFIGVVGDDALGHFMLTAMDERDVDISGCVVDASVQTGVSVILDQAGSELGRAILTAPGSIGALQGAHVDPRYVSRARHIHCGSYFLQDALARDLPDLFAWARAGGATCSVDPNWDPSGRWDSGLLHLLNNCDLLFLNRAEALCITREADEDVALSALLGNRLNVVLKRGAEGGTVCRNARQVVAPAPPMQGVVDTTGAGDSFNAGFLFGELNGWDIKDSLAFALACGTLSTRELGGTSAQPYLLEAQEMATMIRVEEYTRIGSRLFRCVT